MDKENTKSEHNHLDIDDSRALFSILCQQLDPTAQQAFFDKVKNYTTPLFRKNEQNEKSLENVTQSELLNSSTSITRDIFTKNSAAEMQASIHFVPKDILYEFYRNYE